MRLLVALAVAVCCAACGDLPHQISNSRLGAYEVDMAVVPTSGPGTLGQQLVTVWHDARDGNAEIYMRRLDPNGDAEGDEMRLTNDEEQSYEPSIEALGVGTVLVAWYGRARDGVMTAYLGAWTVQGRELWRQTLATPGRNIAVTASEYGDVYCAWVGAAPGGTEAVWGVAIKDQGGEIIGEPELLAPASSHTWNLDVAGVGGGRVQIAFDATAGTRADEIFLITRRPGVPPLVERLTEDDGKPSKYPDLDLIDGGRGGLALTWFDERDGNTEVYVTTSLDQPIDRHATRVTRTRGDSMGAYTAVLPRQGAAGHTINGVGWSDNSDGQYEVFFQAFEDGKPLFPARQLTHNATASLVPAIVPWRDGFMLAWTEFVDSRRGHVGRSEIATMYVSLLNEGTGKWPPWPVP